MAKNWWFKFDFRLWRTDSDLRRCSLETKGFWLEVLCIMHETGDYKVEGTLEDLARLVGCHTSDITRCAIELQRTKTADVTLGNGTVTLVSRRLKRELKEREQTRLRVQRHRGNAPVTVQSNKKEIKSKKEEEKRPTQASATPRGTRLPEPFHLTTDMRAWAAEKRPCVDPVLETEKFVNYWRAKSGRDATKLDWRATWNNWILNAKESNGTPKFNNGKPTPAETILSRDYYNDLEH